IRNFALYPVALTGEAITGGWLPPTLSVVSYMFLHGGWLHLLFNMLFLFTFGDNIEDALGHGRYLVFYLLCGIGAGFAHALVSPESNTPLVGASGAIPLRLGSAWVLGFWILVQVWHVLVNEKGDTAWWAHIGGLGIGALLILVMRPPGVPLFECMRPGDVLVARASPPAGGPWSAR